MADYRLIHAIQRWPPLAPLGGDRDVAHALLSWAETEYAEHELE